MTTYLELNSLAPQHVANLIFHIGSGVIGILIGLVPLLAQKGGRAHRRWGRVFAIFAGVVVATAVLSDIFSAPPAALVAVTLSAGYQLVGGLRSLTLRNSAGPNGLDALLAIGALVAAAIILLKGGPAKAGWTPPIEYATLGYVTAVALYDHSRHAWAARWVRSMRPLDHGLKMTGVWIAMASAGSGNLLAAAHVVPLNQILPPAINAIGLVLMAVIALAYTRGLRPAQSVATLTTD